MAKKKVAAKPKANKADAPKAKVTFGQEVEAKFKISATGMMSKVVAEQWLKGNQAAAAKIEKADTAAKVRQIVTECESAKADEKAKAEKEKQEKESNDDE